MRTSSEPIAEPAASSEIISPIQDISLNVSYSLIHDASPRNGTLKIKIHDVPEKLLKNTESSRVERSKNPDKQVPFSDDELLLKKVIHIATMRTVHHLQRRFTDILKEMRSVSRDSFEQLRVLSYDEFATVLKENGNVESVETEECGICLEKYDVKKQACEAQHQVIAVSNKRSLEEDVENQQVKENKKRKLNTGEQNSEPDAENSEPAVRIADEINTYTHEPVQLTNCVHIFGRNCLYSWCNNNNSCPLCREKISPKNVEYSMEELNQVLQDDEQLTSISYIDLLEEANRDPSDVMRRPFFNTNDDNERSSLFIVSGSGPEVTDGNNTDRPYLTDPRLQTLIERTLTRLSEMLRDRENALRTRNTGDENSLPNEASNDGNTSFPFNEGMPPRIRLAQINENNAAGTDTNSRIGTMIMNPAIPQMLSQFLRTGVVNSAELNPEAQNQSAEPGTLTSGSINSTSSGQERSETSNRNLGDILRSGVREMMNMVGSSSNTNEDDNTGDNQSASENSDNSVSES